MTSPFGELLVVDEAWASAARSALNQWHHNGDVDEWVDGMVVRYGERETIRRIASIGRDFPLPFGQLVMHLDSGSQAQLRSMILGGESGDQVAQRVAGRLRVDSGFLDGLRRTVHQSLVGRTRLAEPARTNVAIASNSEPEFRRWLAGALIPGGR